MFNPTEIFRVDPVDLRGGFIPAHLGSSGVEWLTGGSQLIVTHIMGAFEKYF